MSTLASLHGRRGGTTSKNPHKISEKDGFALVVGATMMWAHFRDSTNPEFWETIGREVKDAEGTEVLWPKNEIIRLFHETVLNTIGQVGLGLHHSLRRGTFGAWRRSLVLCCIHSNGQRRGALEGLGAPKQWCVLSQASPPKLAGLREDEVQRACARREADPDV